MGNKRIEFFGILDEVFKPPVDVVVEAGHVFAFLGGVEIVDHAGAGVAHAGITFGIGVTVFLAKLTVRLVAVDGTIVGSEWTQDLPEKLHVATLRLANIVSRLSHRSTTS